MLKTGMSHPAKAVALLGVLLVSVMLGIGAEHKAGDDVGGLLAGIYAFGFAFLSGMFAIFPGGTRARNEWGDKVRVGSINNLSTAQSVILLAWFVGFGAVVVYFMNF